MKKKAKLTGVLFVLCLILFSSPAWAGIIENPDQARIGQLITVTADAAGTWYSEGPATTTIYSDENGTVVLGADETAATVYWRLPKSISTNPAQYIIVWTAADGSGTQSTEPVNVYQHVELVDKEEIGLIYYPGLTEEMTASGGLPPYTWTVIGPDLQIESVITNVVAGNPFEFVAPSTGEFAGIHTAWVSDQLKRVIDDSLTGADLEEAEGRDNVELYEFAWLDGEHFFLEEDSAPVTYTLTGAPTHPIDPETGDYLRDPDTGAPITMTYSFKIMAENTESSTEYTGLPAEYGRITLDNGNAPISGSLVITYHPPTAPTSANSFWIRGNASEELIYSVGNYETNIYDVWLGPITIRLKSDINGVIVDENKNPISGANILLIAPEQYQAQYVTGADGAFNFSLLKGQKYYFQADAPGFASKLFTSTSFDNEGGSITLEAADAQNYIHGSLDYTPGTGNLEDGSIATVSLVDYNQSPAEVIAETKVVYANKLGTQAYRLDIPGDAPLGQSYALIAYTQNYSATQIFRIAELPADGLQLPFQMDMDMQEYLPPTAIVDGTATPLEYKVAGAELEPIAQTSGAAPQVLAAPTYLGGVAFEIRNSDDELRFQADMRPGFTDTSVLTATSTVKISMASEETPLTNDITGYLDGYTEYANGSLRLLEAIVNTASDINGNGNSEIVGEHGAVMTLPFDLLTVEIGDFESGIYYVRRGVSRTDLATSYAYDLPLSDILAIDYLGDGETGWVTFKADSFSYYGIGGSEGTTYKGAGSYKWAEFERYELWGCFVDSLEKQPVKTRAALGAAALFLAGCLALMARRRRRAGA
ncbi:carboxypeptidase-like regulatory domain-containing protein [Desulfatibacillum aliphaticivorans]|uniref:carboxypeptidase-like regulatory domain-containing protein n=1 Tax=Desulfatibacillum aliphaticivorans TaxID=218208 RepID=UPI000481631E|nr:carboxypeptidase-like regulatory domain-containing protein [Desulfatibacillum aliphaticivorans]